MGHPPCYHPLLWVCLHTRKYRKKLVFFLLLYIINSMRFESIYILKKCILNPCCGLAGGELVICRSRTKWSLGWWGWGEVGNWATQRHCSYFCHLRSRQRQ
ncbi:hypothetical protein Peur_010639 [Populus x canadensis]